MGRSWWVKKRLGGLGEKGLTERIANMFATRLEKKNNNNSNYYNCNYN